MTTKDTLEDYGHNFQVKVIASFFDVTYLHRIYDLIVPSYFTTDTLEWITDTFIKYYKQYKSAPTPEVFKLEMSKSVYNKDEAFKIAVLAHLKDVYRAIDSPDLEFTKNEMLTFCQNQAMRNAINDSISLLQAGQYDAIKQKISQALRAGSDNDIGLEYKKHIDECFDEAIRNVIPTPWSVVNDLADGGFGAGELIVLIAGPGGGKSMSLVNIAAEAVKAGKNVIYYTLELNRAYVGHRFNSYYTQIPIGDLKMHKDEVKAAAKKLKGNLIIKYWPTKSANLSTIEAHIEKCKALGFSPDMIVIDYADLLRLDSGRKNNGGRHDENLGNLYAELRGLAGQYNIPVYTASQVNRAGADEDIIEGSNIAESYAKIMVADFVISLSRKLADKISNTGRWHVIKNRFGPDGRTFPSKLNLATCHIQIYSETSIEGKNVQNTMDNSKTVEKKIMQTRYKTLIEAKVS